MRIGVHHTLLKKLMKSKRRYRHTQLERKIMVVPMAATTAMFYILISRCLENLQLVLGGIKCILGTRYTTMIIELQ